MRSVVTIGLVGCGALGRLVHLPILRQLPNVRLVAIADPDAAALGAAAALVPAAARFDDYERLLALEEIDAAIVALPTTLHATVGIQALAAGKHLYLEKPLAVTLCDGEQLVDRWRQSGRIGVIGFNYRFHPLYVRLREMVRRGDIGEVVAVRTVFSSAWGPVPAWKSTRDTGGGALLDLGVHHIDLVRFLLQRDVVSVAAQLHGAHSEDDRVSLDLQLAGGVIGQSLFALAAVDEDRIEVYGERGKLTVDRFHSVNVEHRPAALGTSRAGRLGLGRRGPSLGGVITSPVLVQRLRAPTAEPSYRPSLASFVDAVSARRQSAPDLADGLAALAVLDAALRSATEGRRVGIAPAGNQYRGPAG